MNQKHKTLVAKIQHFLHEILWSRFFLPSILFLILIITIIQLCLNILNPPEHIETWRIWVIFAFSTIGTFSGLCGTYFVNRRSIKWVYFQIITIPSLILALAFSFLPLQAIMWTLMTIPGIIMYFAWKKQENPNQVHPKKLGFKKVFIYFVLAIIISVALGFIVKIMNNVWTPFLFEDNGELKEGFHIDIAPFADSFILVFSFFAPFLIAKRYWAGNYFFIIANIISIFLYAGLIGEFYEANYLFMFQSIIYLFYSTIGVSSWITIYNSQQE